MKLPFGALTNREQLCGEAVETVRWRCGGLLRAAALTGDGGAVALRVQHHQFVLQAAATHSLGTNQDQRLPPEGRDLGHLFVYSQLVAVELCEVQERAELQRDMCSPSDNSPE